MSSFFLSYFLISPAFFQFQPVSSVSLFSAWIDHPFFTRHLRFQCQIRFTIIFFHALEISSPSNTFHQMAQLLQANFDKMPICAKFDYKVKGNLLSMLPWVLITWLLLPVRDTERGHGTKNLTAKVSFPIVSEAENRSLGVRWRSRYSIWLYQWVFTSLWHAGKYALSVEQGKVTRIHLIINYAPNSRNPDILGRKKNRTPHSNKHTPTNNEVSGKRQITASDKDSSYNTCQEYAYWTPTVRAIAMLQI